MPYLTLTLNGFPVDLPADAQVALSYQVNDVRNLDSRDPAFSIPFTLPLTAQNRQVLGNPHDLASGTTTPYRLLPAVLTSPGGAVVLDGFGILESSGEGYEVTLTNASGGLRVAVGNRKLRDLDLRDLDHPLTYAALLAADANGPPDGYTYALFDTGVLAGRPQNFDLTPDELPASVFVLALLEAMLLAPLPPVPQPVGYLPESNPLAGWRLTGSLLADPLFQAMVVPRATAYPQLRAGYVEQFRVKARYAKPIVLTYASSNILQFPDLLAGDADRFTLGQYVPPTHAISLRVQVRLPVEHTGSGLFFGVYDYDPATSNAVQVAVMPGLNENSGRSVVTLDVTLPVLRLAAGHRLTIGTFIQNEDTRLTIQAGASLSYTVLPRAWPEAPVHLEAGLPDMGQAELLKLIFNQFNVILQADPLTKTLRLDLFNDVERNRARAVDWTHLLDFTQRPRLQYRVENYAQTNTLTYAEQPELVTEQLAPVEEEAQGRGILLTRDATLPDTREAFATDLVLPLEHSTGFLLAPLLWVPLFAQSDSEKAVFMWDSQHAYSRDDVVIYKGQTWLCTVGDHQTTNAPPPWGDSRAFPGDRLWEVTTDAWPIKNDEVGTVARLTAYVPLAGQQARVLEAGLQGAAYVPRRQLSRAGLDFAELLPAYYGTLAECLQRVQLLTVDIRLGALDIASLDFTVPRRLGPVDVPGYGRLACLGYLNLIDQYQPGSPGAVAVQLLVLQAPVPGLAPAVPLPVAQVLTAFVDEENAYYLLDEAGNYLLAE